MSHLRPTSDVTSASLPHSRSADLLQKATIALAASLFVAACAHVSVPLPMTPVPFTLQPFAVILVGMLLGPQMGFAALVAYLCEGAAGLPVWTPAGLPGVARLLGPTAGYLFAYPVAAALAGGLAKVVPGRRFITFAVGGAAAMLLVYACGAAWFSQTMHVPFAAAMAGAVAPFALTDAVKVCIAAGIATAWKTRASR